MIYYFLKNNKKTAFVMKSFFLSQSFNVVTLTSEKIT